MSNELINRQYVGARYVPKVVGEWNKALSYEALSIVTYKGNSFTSKIPVPPNVDINNETFWVNTGNYNAQVEEYRKNTLKLLELISLPEDYGAIGDGNTNDTDALNKWLNDGKFFKALTPNKNYLVNTLDEITGKTFIIDGQGATISTNDNTVLYISAFNNDTSNIELNNIVFNGINTNTITHQNFPLLRLYSGNNKSLYNIRINNCSFINNGGYGVGCYSDSSLYDIVFNGCFINNINGVGIANSNASVKIINTKINNTGAECITIDNNSHDCVIKNNTLSLYGHGGCIGIDTATNIIIEGNTIDGNNNTAVTDYQNGISINSGTGFSDNLFITNNLIKNNQRCGIAVGTINYVDATVLKNCVISNNNFINNANDIYVLHGTNELALECTGNNYSSPIKTDISLDNLFNKSRIDQNVNIGIAIEALNNSEITNLFAFINGHSVNIKFTLKIGTFSTDGFKDLVKFHLPIPVGTLTFKNSTYFSDTQMGYIKTFNLANTGILNSYIVSGEGQYITDISLSFTI